MQKCFITGCGYIGERVGKLWLERGAEVSALCRTEERAERLKAMGIIPVLGDLDDESSLLNLPLQNTLLYYFAPPPKKDVIDSRIRSFVTTALNNDLHPEKVVYISTSGVYGDCNGEWVTEETPPHPETDRAKRRMDAETELWKWGTERNVPVIILRVPGIYGPGRLPVERLKKRLPVVRERDAPFSNRIHADDLAQVCMAAAIGIKESDIINVSDGRPDTMTNYFNKAADFLSLPRPPSVGMEEAKKMLSSSLLSFLGESRRIDNRKMLNKLRITLRYRTLEEGLKASISE